MVIFGELSFSRLVTLISVISMLFYNMGVVRISLPLAWPGNFSGGCGRTKILDLVMSFDANDQLQNYRRLYKNIGNIGVVGLLTKAFKYKPFILNLN